MADRSLHAFVEEATGESHLRVEKDYGDGFVRLRTSEAERRQAAQDIQCSENIVLELLRNARDAHATHVFLAVAREGAKRQIVAIDDGDGIPKAMHELVFEPRVTSKLDTSRKDAWGLHGRGMALFSIAQNALSAQVASSAPKLGCSVAVVTDTQKLPEKRDQSSFPRFVMGEEGSVNVRGPKNIVRTACEFAIQERDACTVFVGSPAEIVAALYAYGTATLSPLDRVFCKDIQSLPLVKRLAAASDAADLAEQAASMGLEVSERTARRVMDGQIEEAQPLLERIVIETPNDKTPAKRKTNRASSRSVRLHRDDKAALAESVREGFAEIADKYYLERSIEPQVRVTADRIIVSIPVVERND